MLLFLFFIASIVVGANTVVANSLSPPQFLEAEATFETPQLKVVLSECDIFYSWFENSQPAILQRVPVPGAMNFQVLINQNNVSVSSSGKADMLKSEAISPTCRTVITSNLSQIVFVCIPTIFLEAISPACRTVFV